VGRLPAALWLAGCAAATTSGPPPEDRGAPVWVVGHGWHVGLAVRRADIPPDVWPESGDLGPSRHLEVGWGDGAFFPARRGTSGMALRAAFASTSSVLHVAAFDAPVPEFFPDSPIVELTLGPAAFVAFCRFVRGTYGRDAGGRIVPVAPGAYGHGRFYQARGRYHLFSNSNNWAARALEAAGLDLDARWAFTAGWVLRQARQYGRPVRDLGGVRAPRPGAERAFAAVSPVASSPLIGATR
jgi:uncharacterized protein (TIGR02117 family)